MLAQLTVLVAQPRAHIGLAVLHFDHGQMNGSAEHKAQKILAHTTLEQPMTLDVPHLELAKLGAPRNLESALVPLHPSSLMALLAVGYCLTLSVELGQMGQALVLGGRSGVGASTLYRTSVLQRLQGLPATFLCPAAQTRMIAGYLLASSVSVLRRGQCLCCQCSVWRKQAMAAVCLRERAHLKLHDLVQLLFLEACYDPERVLHTVNCSMLEESLRPCQVSSPRRSPATLSEQHSFSHKNNSVLHSERMKSIQPTRLLMTTRYHSLQTQPCLKHSAGVARKFGSLGVCSQAARDGDSRVVD